MDYNSRNFCILPWSHVYFFTDGYAYPCPKLAGNIKFRLGKNSDPLEALWNSQVLKDMRVKMLSNKPILECDKHCNDNLSSCKKYVGLDLLDSTKPFIDSTNTDGSVSRVNFIGANIIESNKCNLKCQYCCSAYSNQHLENKKQLVCFTEKNNLFNTHLFNFKEIWLAGGEPVIQESTYKLLNSLIINNQTNIRLRVITNLTQIKYKNYDFYNLLSKFNDVIVFGSWDMDGKIGEYIRKNSNSNMILANIKHIKTFSNIKFYLQPVISIFNIMHIFDFHKRMFDLNLLKKSDIRYYILTSPEIFCISILPAKIKQTIEPQLNNYIQWLYSDKITDLSANLEHPGEFIKKIITLMNTGKGGQEHIKEENRSELFKKFISYVCSEDFKNYSCFKFLSLYKKYNFNEYI